MQKVKDIMTRFVESMTPNATVQDAAMKLKDLNVGAIPVCDRRRLLGIKTENFN